MAWTQEQANDQSATGSLRLTPCTHPAMLALFQVPNISSFHHVHVFLPGRITCECQTRLAKVQLLQTSVAICCSLNDAPPPPCMCLAMTTPADGPHFNELADQRCGYNHYLHVQTYVQIQNTKFTNNKCLNPNICHSGEPLRPCPPCMQHLQICIIIIVWLPVNIRV